MFNILDVITIGSATRDVYLKSEDAEIRKHSDSPSGIEQCFPLGAKIEVKQVVFTTGGGGTNAAVTFSRQGLKTGCVGVVGDDFNGKEIIKELNREKVKLFFTIHKDDLTAYSVILVHPNAERTILSYKGEGQHFYPVIQLRQAASQPNAEGKSKMIYGVNSDEIKWKKLKAKWFFLDSLGGNWNLLERAFEYITARNFKIAFNPGGKELAHGLEKLKPYLAEVDVFSLNKEEGELLLKSKIQMTNDKMTAEEILEGLSELVKGIVVLTLGPEGVLVSDKNKIYKAGTPDSPRVERTGAGDAFNSGFVAQMIKQNQPEAGSWKPEAVITSIQFATANASSVVSQYGPKAGIIRKGDFGPWPLVEVKVTF